MIPRSNKIDKTINITGFDRIHSKCCCNNGTNANGVLEPILFSFALHELPGHKI